MGSPAKPSLEVRVECYAGHRGEETPRRFSFGGRTVEVAEVLDAWLAPDYHCFKFRGCNGASYILRNDVLTRRWEVTMFGRTCSPLSHPPKRWPPNIAYNESDDTTGYWAGPCRQLGLIGLSNPLFLSSL